MEQYIKDNLKMELPVGKANLGILKAIVIKGNGRIIKLKESASLLKLQEGITKEDGKMINLKAMEYRIGAMAISIKVSSEMDSNKDKDSINGVTNQYTKDNGTKAKFKEGEFISIMMEESMKVNGNKI